MIYLSDIIAHNDTHHQGNRYCLKLFRDFVFHQDTSDGNPSTDFGHVIESLNKLDAGSDEKILLMSRDSKNILVVTYNDIRNCLDEAFSEIIGLDAFRVDQIRTQELQRVFVALGK